MKTESLMLISDARNVLTKTVQVEAQDNALLGAFMGWLDRDETWLALLEQAAERAAAAKGAERNSRTVAVLGFACGIDRLKPQYDSEFIRQLEWAMGRPNFSAGGEPCGLVADPLNLAGIIAGADCSTMSSEKRRQFEPWVLAVWNDAKLMVVDANWRGGLLNIIRGRIDNSGRSNLIEPVWVGAGLHRRDWATPSDTAVSDVLKSALTDAAQVNDGFEAGMRLAAIEWAVARAMDFDLSALTVQNVADVLHRVPTVFQRWTWEDKPRTARKGAAARRWHIENEYHFQSLLYAVLKPLLPALEEERYLPPTGTYQPRADLCVSALELVVEVKFWYRGKSVKELTEEIAADLTLYLRQDSPYRMVIAVIWDDGARTEDHSEIERGLKGLAGLFDVVIVNCPSSMNMAVASKSLKKNRRKNPAANVIRTPEVRSSVT